MSDWERLEKETVDQNDWYRISRDRYRLPNGGTGTYTYVDIPGSTMVVPVLPDGRLVMVEQYRYLMQRPSLEFPCGGLKVGWEPLTNAQAELREEAGLEAASWSELGRLAPYNGVSNEYCFIFHAEEFTEVPVDPEETEEIRVVHLTRDEVRARIVDASLWDGMTVSAFTLYESRLT